MAEHGGPVRPLGDDAVAVSSKKMHRYIISSSNSNCNSNSKNTRQQQEQQQRQQQKGPSSLVSRCMAVLVANLERYPPSVLGMLAENEWNDLIATKHEKTAPRQGTGGLDGTGRRTPALSERFLREVETANPHLAESKCADTLIWKDCVECQFKRDGLTRPRALLLPWPLLVQQIVDLSDVLVAYKTQEDELDKEGHQLALTEEVSANITEATMALKESPMNVTLLKDSGIGKVLKKLIKASSSRSKKSIFKRLKLPTTNLPARTAVAANVKEVSVLKQLERLLQAWMDLAASQGIAISSNSSSPPRKGDMTTSFEKDQQDLQRAETCNTWRKLFAVLKDRADQRRFHLGQKMRAKRKDQNSLRPQIIKVRPANPRREQILDRDWCKGSSEKAGTSKLNQIRKEAALYSARAKQDAAVAFKRPTGFGSAVAIAAAKPRTLMKKARIVQQQSKFKRKAAPVVALGGGKRMAVPSRTMRMQGGTFSGKKPKR